MKKQTHNPTTMIKSAFSNAVHKILEPNHDVKRRDRWKTQYREKYKLTDQQKIEKFDEILKLHQLTSTELINYQQDRNLKKKVRKEREARGWTPKVKTPKA